MHFGKRSRYDTRQLPDPTQLDVIKSTSAAVRLSSRLYNGTLILCCKSGKLVLIQAFSLGHSQYLCLVRAMMPMPSALLIRDSSKQLQSGIPLSLASSLYPLSDMTDILL